MQVNLRVRRWVAWWFYIGVICGGIALANIFGRDLTRSQEQILLLIGALHWILGGIVCWAFESVRIQSPAQREARPEPASASSRTASRAMEWHSASDFLLPGNSHSLLPSSEAFNRRPRKSLRDSLRASGERPLR
jgi:hypothetical protein